MINSYKKLALKLDQIPNGFPPTKSGVELKILEKLFTADEAEIASQMSNRLQSTQDIAQLAGLDYKIVYTALKAMTKKGLLDLKKGEGVLLFKLIPFVVGFYERQNAQIDEEFAQLFEKYFHEAFHKIMAHQPALHRIIPVEKAIPLDVEVMPYERATTYIENAKSWGVLPCICRTQRRLIGKGCHHSEENCLVFANRPDMFARVDTIRSIDKAEANSILLQSAKEGLIHSTSNVQEGINYICNCCTCSCGIIRGISEYGILNSVGRSDFYAFVDNNKCNGCGICIDRCQFKALEIVDDNFCKVNPAFCYGCGLCVTTCPTAALKLKEKSDEECNNPPLTESDWQKSRTRSRKG